MSEDRTTSKARMGWAHAQMLGNLTRDTKHKDNEGAKINVAFNAMAVNFWDGREEATMFIDLTFFDKLADTARDHFGKGDRVFVDGNLSTTYFVDGSGVRRPSIKLIVGNIERIKMGKERWEKFSAEKDMEKDFKGASAAIAAQSPPKKAKAPAEDVQSEELPF